MQDMRTSLFVIACSSLLWAGCSKDSKTADNPGAASTAALWAMAPASADVGVVVAPGTGNTLLAAWTTVESSVARQPAGAMIRDAIRKEMPPQVLDPQAHEKMGLDLSRGAALFVTADDEPLAIVPVKDREAFRKAQGGKADGDVDVFEKTRCQMIQDLYVCAESAELLAQAGKSDAMAKKVAARPASLRGHIEVHVDSSRLAQVDDMPLQEYFKNPGALTAAIQIERGAFTARAHLPATPATPLVAAFARVPDNLARSAVESKKAPSMWRLRVPVGELIPKDQAAAEMAPAAAMIAGFDPRADLLDNLTGEMIFYSQPTGSMNLSLEIGLNNGKRLQTAVTTLCSFAKAAGLPVEIEMKGDSCVATIDPAVIKALDPALAAIPFEGRFTVAVTTTDKAVGVHLGMVDQGKAVDVKLGSLARELMTDKWTWAMWGSGVSLEGLDPAMLDALKEEPKAHDAAMLTLWMLGHITETGAGVAVRDDGLHAVMHLGTQWGNPDPVLQEFEKLLGDMLAGDASAADKLEALAEKSPDTVLGKSYQAGGAGMGAVAGGIGTIAAVAIPSFVKYQQRSKAAAAEFEAAAAELEAAEAAAEAGEAAGETE